MELGTRQKAWINALESGEFKQGHGVLCSNYDGWTYCCLGVYCEVLIKHGVDIKKKLFTFDEDEYGTFVEFNDEGDGNVFYEFEGKQDEEFIPDFLVEVMGLHSYNGAIHHNEESQKEFDYDNLAEANDAGVSFQEIVTFIKKYPETVFTKSI